VDFVGNATSVTSAQVPCPCHCVDSPCYCDAHAGCSLLLQLPADSVIVGVGNQEDTRNRTFLPATKDQQVQAPHFTSKTTGYTQRVNQRQTSSS